MSEEEKEICIGRRSGKTYNKIQEMTKEIVRLEKELKLKDKVIDKLQKENEDMREELQMYVDTPINKLIVGNEELQKVKEQSQGILSSIKIAYMVHTKDCELLLKDIKKWEKILDK